MARRSRPWRGTTTSGATRTVWSSSQRRSSCASRRRRCLHRAPPGWPDGHRAASPHKGGTTMFNTIVVGVDGREGGRDALALAGFLQPKFGSDLIAVFAYHHDPFPSRASSPPFETAMEDEATQAVHEEV